MSKDFDIEDVDYEVEKKKHPIRRLFFLIILISILTVIYSRYVGTSGLLVKEYSIKSNNITDLYNGLKIAHFSDFHYGRTTGIDELKNLIEDINKTKPDVIVFTGDFIDKDTKIDDTEMANIIEQLKKLNSTYGKYYVNGEDDNKFDKYNQMMESSDFTSLNNSYDIIYNANNETILLTGLNTKKDIKFLDDVFKENYNYKINIMHYPDDFDDIKIHNYDLVLAGHSHNGQIALPYYGGILTTSHASKYHKTYYKSGNTNFYISSGIGVSDYNFRLFNRPSYNLYRLLKK